MSLGHPGRRSWRFQQCVAAAALAAPLLLAGSPVLSQAAEDWLGTWSASPQPVWGASFFAAAPIPRSLRDQTVRQVARVSQGGDQVRVEFSNEYGEHPMVIGGARIAQAGEDGVVVAGTDRPLTFSGRDSITVPPGAPVWSDPVEMQVKDLDELAVSLYLPEVTPLTTWHNDGRQTAYVLGNGDFTAEENFETAYTTNSRLFLSGIQVGVSDGARSVVLFGNSITDGNSSTPNENNRWPDILGGTVGRGGIGTLRTQRGYLRRPGLARSDG